VIFYTIESVKQLQAWKGFYTFRHVCDIVVFISKKQLWIHCIENGRISAFLAVNAFGEVEIAFCCINQIFLELHLSEINRYRLSLL